jgi:RimJ/RimL family protein N-acetyltransferase
MAAARSINGGIMPAPNQSTKIPRKKVRIHSEKYLIRTLETDDASDHWASWMSDPEATSMLNLAARSWSKADIIEYIKTFDQRSRLLLGIFDKQSGAHIGIFTVSINHLVGRYYVNLLIGEPAYRNKHVTTHIAESFREYFFETLGMNAAMASVLAHNARMIHYLLKHGWKLDQTLKQNVKSHADGAMLDVCLFSLSREDWREWRKKIRAQKTTD